MSIFQSFLIVGSDETKGQETTRIAQSMKIDLTHASPDISVITPIKSHITIDQIRELKRHIFQKPVQDPVKFIIIEQAGKLTLEAQNALLKILEEPPSHAILVLEAKDKSQILPTIRSRVIIKHAISQPVAQSKNLLMEEKNVIKLLEEISQIENPGKWLDSQILVLYNHLKEKIRADEMASSAQITSLIQKCKEAKEIIEANVNPKFALTNLIFSLKKLAI